MKAIRIHSFGGPEVLVYEDAPRPPIADDEVLPLAEAHQAHEISQSGHARGKIVLSMVE